MQETNVRLTSTAQCAGLRFGAVLPQSHSVKTGSDKAWLALCSALLIISKLCVSNVCLVPVCQGHPDLVHV